MSTILLVSFILNILIAVYAAKAQRGSFGVMGHVTGDAILWLCGMLSIPVAVIALDMRKVHEMILAFGYRNTTMLVGRFIKMRYGKLDFIYQKGGDEFVIFVVFPGALTAERIAERMVKNMAAITETMTDEQRNRLSVLTGGLIDQLAASIAYVSCTRMAHIAAQRAMDAANAQKIGEITGNRATSGMAGTIINELVDF